MRNENLYQRVGEEFSAIDRRLEGIYNWSRIYYLCSHRQVAFPRTEEELRDIIVRRGLKQIRMLGSSLAYEKLNKLDYEEDKDALLISLEKYIRDDSTKNGLISETENTVTFTSGVQLEEVYSYLLSRGKMLPSSPGVIAICTLAGSIATGSHGQGMRQSTFGDSVVKLKLVQADGSVVEKRRGVDEDFGAYAMHYGCLGVVTEVTFATVPVQILHCKKSTTDFGTLLLEYAAMNQRSDFVKAWWFPSDDKVQIWEASPADQEQIALYEKNQGQLTELAQDRDASLNETVDQIVVQMAHETRDLAQTGRQFETVLRFKNVSNVIGNVYQIFCKGIPVHQINCEIAIPFDRMNEALSDLRAWHAKSTHKPHYPFILRCTGKSECYLSGAYQRETCWIGFLVYLSEKGEFLEGSFQMMREIQEILAKHEGIPHLGKHFVKELFDLPKLLPRWNEFRELRKKVDPNQIFSN